VNQRFEGSVGSQHFLKSDLFLNARYCTDSDLE